MNTALILPYSQLGQTAFSSYHLCLVDQVLRDSTYRRYYRARRDLGEFVILDNSAHELGVGESPELLRLAAYLISPSEIVLPDVLFDWGETVARSRSGYESLRGLGIPMLVVPQGRDSGEWERCLDLLLELSPAAIGISKDFETWGPQGLVPLIEHSLQFNLPLHLLGWGRRLELLPLYAEVGGGAIRGIDSAKPAVYAAAGIRLPEDLKAAPPYPGIPEGFFSLYSIDSEVLEWNVQVFQQAARSSISV